MNVKQSNRPAVPQVQRPVDSDTVNLLSASALLKEDVESYVSCKTLPVPKRVKDVLYRSIQDSLAVLVKEFGGES